jgi:hypothetical protein
MKAQTVPIHSTREQKQGVGKKSKTTTPLLSTIDRAKNRRHHEKYRNEIAAYSISLYINQTHLTATNTHNT